ncbi:hypothetical protein [Yersinia similis]|uniref:hypothetical protein n=1 Tax=Yersinia similis TaxID=367190 RepID=UPI00090939C8|nr:hypothetical protein [Yersinia similis]
MCRKSLNQPFFDGHMNDGYMNDGYMNNNHGVDTGSALPAALASFPLSMLYPPPFKMQGVSCPCSPLLLSVVNLKNK